MSSYLEVALYKFHRQVDRQVLALKRDCSARVSAMSFSDSILYKTTVQLYLSIYGIYIAPLQGNYSEALPAQAQVKIKGFKELENELDKSRIRERSSDGRLFQAGKLCLSMPFRERKSQLSVSLKFFLNPWMIQLLLGTRPMTGL